MCSSTVLAHNFSHGLVKQLIVLNEGDSDVDFQSSEEDNNDDDDEVAAGPSSEDLSAGNESEAEPGQHQA